MSTHYLSPFVTVEKRGRSLAYKHILSKTELVTHIETPLQPDDETTNTHLFWRNADRNSEHDIVFDHLESAFLKSHPTVGYIETTSRCPFLCVMCPKSNNLLIREEAQMPQETFVTLVSQLKHQKCVTLHLFGDPLMDPLILKRLATINDYGLKASFSTNIPMFASERVFDLLDYNIESIVVSIDSLDPHTYSRIRKSPTNKILDYGHFLRKLDLFLDAAEQRGERLGKIVLRIVDMNINEATRDQLLSYKKRYSRVEIDIKHYINFPNTNRPDLGARTFFQDNTPVFLYQLLGNPLPFRCLKPWRSCELAVQSDGKVVPCCLCYNAPFSLGNIKENSLEELYFSENYKNYRRCIFYNEAKADWICNSCHLYKEKYFLKEISEGHFDYLMSYLPEQ